MPPLLNGDKEKTLFCGWWDAYLQLLWIIMSHAFVCLPTLELTTFEQQVCSTKIGYANELLFGTNSRKKKKCGRFGERTSSKKSSATLTVVGFNENRRRCTLFLLNFLNLRDLLGVRIKLKKNIFKNNNQTNFTVTTRAGFFSKGWTRAFPSARLVSEWKNGSGPCLLKCSLFRCKMLFFRMQGCCIILAKMKSMSLCLS